MHAVLQSLSLAFSFFLLMDPIGNIPIYISLLKELHPKKQRRIILRELLIALAIILLFYFVGDWILEALRVAPETIQISGGIILFIIAIRMIFPPVRDTSIEPCDDQGPFIVPLAVPLVAGPSILAAVIIYAHNGHGYTIMIPALIIAWLISTLILLSASIIQKLLGKRGIVAIERLMGFILTLIALQMFLEGFAIYLKSL